jgi:dTDP-4-dehydrorhamnose reductase
VVNAIGIVKQLPEASMTVTSIAVNSLLPHQLNETCTDVGAQLVHFSTDCVFSGALPVGERYSEDHQPDARDLYGRSKLLGEAQDGAAVTLRTSIIGCELHRSSGLLEWFANQDGKTVGGFTRAIFSGLTTRALARVVGEVVDQHSDLRGIYHVASEPITKLTYCDCFARP